MRSINSSHRTCSCLVALLRFVWWWLRAREPEPPDLHANLGQHSRRFGVLTALGVATVLGLSLVFEWFV